MTPSPPSAARRLTSEWRRKLEAYGQLGLYVYLTIWIASLVTFGTLLNLGVQDRVPWIAEHMGTGATVGGAWLLTKVIQIPRILLTVAVTPIVARITGRKSLPEAESAR